MILTLNLGIIALVFLSEAFNKKQQLLLAGVESVSAPIASGTNVTRLVSLAFPGGLNRSFNKATAVIVTTADEFVTKDGKWSYYRTNYRHIRRTRK